MNFHKRLAPSYDLVVNRLPGRLAGRLDYHLRPHLKDGWGGPLNNQHQRQAIVDDLQARITFDEVVETGTFRGTSTMYFAERFPSVKTVEAMPRYYQFAQHRFRGHKNIDSRLGDSRSFLRMLAETQAQRPMTTLFYLDAHWEQDLPLADELRIISASWPRAVVMVDDFQVPGDAGYTYDDYGPGKALTAQLLPSETSGWGQLYPAVHSSEESGQTRGTLILASPELTTLVSQSPLLRCA